MNISKSGYYKQLKNIGKLNKYEIDRLELQKLIEDIHRRKPSYGYRRINAKILTETGWIVTDNLVHKVCKSLNIKSKARHYRYKRPGEESLKNEMLNNKIKRGYKDLETIFHTDQGAIYSSLSFNNILKDFFITRSMSRAGTPTDNPVIESKNGWLKKEMYIDFDINNYSTVQEFIKEIVEDNNNYRPSYALNYKTPVEYKAQLGFAQHLIFCVYFLLTTSLLSFAFYLECLSWLFAKKHSNISVL